MIRSAHLTGILVAFLTMLISCGNNGDDDPVGPGDTTRPTVVSTSPVDSDTTVAPGAVISVTFSENMNSASITGGALSLSPAVTGTITYTNKTATFTPGSLLGEFINYTATVSTVAKDVAGNTLAAPFSWQFRTFVDSVAPSVQAVSPADHDSTALVNTDVVVTFSEPIDFSTVDASSFSLSPSVSGSFSLSGDMRQVTFTPDAPLSVMVLYTLTLTTAITDTAGNALPIQFQSEFYTAPDTLAPSIDFISLQENSVLGNNGPIRVTTDDAGGIDRVEFFVDGSLAETVISPPYQHQWDTTGFTLGSEHTVSATAYDLAGNSTSTDTITVHYLWWLILEDLFDPSWPRDLRNIFVRSTNDVIQFRIDIHDSWANYKSTTEGIDIAIYFDTDQNGATGRTQVTSGQSLNGIGAEYLIIVGVHGDILESWNGSTWVDEGLVDGLNITNNSNFFEVTVTRERLGNPGAFDFVVAGYIQSADALDFAPDPGNGFVTYSPDGSFTSK